MDFCIYLKYLKDIFDIMLKNSFSLFYTTKNLIPLLACLFIYYRNALESYSRIHFSQINTAQSLSLHYLFPY